MTPRLFLVSLLLAASAGYTAYATRAENVPIREPLARLPLTLAEWQGRDTQRFAPSIERVLGVDEYITRVYTRGAEPYVALYVGYYQSQRQGDTIHSPMNCLPGAGWTPVQSGRADVQLDDQGPAIHVNRYVIQKGLERQVVLYWYQSHGRVVASEYWSKAYMVYDAMRLNRTDAALVRVISPIAASERDDSAAAERAAAFVRVLFPRLGAHLPS